jgi:hypothetical protein
MLGRSWPSGLAGLVLCGALACLGLGAVPAAAQSNARCGVFYDKWNVPGAPVSMLAMDGLGQELFAARDCISQQNIAMACQHFGNAQSALDKLDPALAATLGANLTAAMAEVDCSQEEQPAAIDAAQGPGALADVNGEPPACDDPALVEAIRTRFDEMQRVEVGSGRTLAGLGDPEEGGFVQGAPEAALSGYSATRWCGWPAELDNGETLELYVVLDAKPGEAIIRTLCPTLYASQYHAGSYDCAGAKGPTAP